jgi:glycosyltransferase involved in cell wall biosynthesis
VTTLLVDVQCLQGQDPERGIPRWTVDFLRAVREGGTRIVGLTNPLLAGDVVATDVFDVITVNSRPALRRLGREDEVVYLCPSMFEPVRPIRALLPEHVADSGISICTIAHDLTNYLFPQYYQPRRGDDRLFEARRVLFSSADLHLANSRSTARDMERIWSLPPNRVAWIGSGISPFFNPVVDVNQVLTQFGIDRPFVMTVGRADPRKRTTALIEAFANLGPDLRRRYQLVITCRLTSETRDEWIALATRLGLPDGSMILTGLVNDQELRALYSLCSLFVEPSEYEGFGFPAAEAAACGAAVIVSNSSSLVEILEFEDATFNTHSIGDTTRAIERGLTDDDFRIRNLAVGSEVTQRHNWTDVANRAMAYLNPLARRIDVPEKHCYVSVDSLDRTLLAAEFDPDEDAPTDLAVVVAATPRIKIGLYDRFWATMGGGEQHAGAAALALSQRYDVELIGIEDFDRTKFARILGKPAAAELPLRIIGHEPSAVARASADYDLFINHSYTSEDYCLAPHGVYVVFFPQRYHSPGPNDFANIRFVESEGWAPAAGIRDEMQLEAGTTMTITAGRPDALTFVARGAKGELTFRQGTDERRLDLDGRPSLVSLEVEAGEGNLAFSSAGGDRLRICTPQTGAGHRIRLSSLAQTGIPSFVDSYDLVLGNSHYTSKWIEKRWDRSAVTHYPPVEMRETSDHKEKVILSVGRFFGEESGHCKQQLRLVEAFGKVVDRGVRDWRLVLVGAADRTHREYALAVRRAAAGLPIDVLLNADFGTLNQELARASLYWHATGLGADLNEFPERAEHFGIAPVEAMSTGAIPIVFAAGGPVEVVEHGVSGFHFRTTDELVEYTLEIIGSSEKQRQTLSRAASQRAKDFTSDRFAAELLKHVEQILSRSLR